MTHYADYFSIRSDYAPVMTLADINKSPETWLGFYPHESFIAILRDLLATLNGQRIGASQARTLWITGAYGTGKSHASLVLQKLFCDSDVRVTRWLELRQKLIPETVRDALLARRKEKVLVVYDVNSDGVDAKNQFLMRLQKGIGNALSDGGYTLPLKGRLEDVIERVREEGEHFWKVRDQMQEHLQHLHAGVKTADALEKKLRNETTAAGLASDVMRVLEARNIYLSLDAEAFLEWVNIALEQNGISRLVYVFDEFSSFMERNRAELKTLEQLAEAAQQGTFFFVPVTHMDISSYVAAGSESAKKANNRFAFKRLEMPNETALKLAAEAFVDKPKMADEWRKDRDELWNAVQALAENYMASNGSSIAAEDFKGILPVHPMAAFLLKHLAVAIGSNQRSMFGFLNGDEFRIFAAQGSLDVPGKQFLTVDHLWAYFIERDDLGTDKRIQEARAEFTRRAKDLQPEEQRVFKAVLLFGLVEAMQGVGSPLLSVSEENIKRCFEGDGALLGVESVLRNLEQRHCFSIVNGRCERFHDRADTGDLTKKTKDLMGQFDALVLADTQNEIDRQLKDANYGNRFTIRAASVNELSTSNLKDRKAFGSDGNRILVQFILAKNEQEQLCIPDKVQALAKHFNDHRMLFVTLPETSFCRDNARAWEEFVENNARLALATDEASKKVFNTQIKNAMSKWSGAVTMAAKLTVCTPNKNGEPFSEETTWGLLGKKLADYAKQVFSAYTDDQGGYYSNAFGAPTGLQNYALAGMRFEHFDGKFGSGKTYVGNFQRAGIRGDEAWFDENPQHPLTQMRDFCKDRQDNTVGKGNTCSIRKLYNDLQRPPFGLLMVPHSAFVLGFVLKGWLDGQRKLQWTDGVQSQTLDAQTLAEMIEAAVKDDGRNQIKNEKLICRLSKEEKAFIVQSGKIFGYAANANGTVEGALPEIEQAVEHVSERVPLWVLPDYIANQGDPNAEAMREVIEKLCAANSISSRPNNMPDRVNKVKEIGARLLATEGLAEALHAYMTPLVFAKAFHAYVDSAKPELRDCADRLGDNACAYCGEVKKKLAETAGWLWKPGDVDAVLNDVLNQYQCAEIIRDLAGGSGFLSFEDAEHRLQSALFEENKVPSAYWMRKHPALARLWERDIAAAQLKDILVQQKETLRNLFFSTSREYQYDALKELFPGEWPTVVAESRDLYNVFPADFVSLPEAVFIQQGREAIEQFRTSLTSKQLVALWRDKTGTDSPTVWSREKNLPAEFALTFADARGAVETLINPSGASPERLKALLEDLSQDGAFALDSEARFLARILPARYQKLGLGAQALAEALRNDLGTDANRWLADAQLGDAVEAFVKANYQTHTRAKAAAKVKAMPDAQAKGLLLKLIEELPDVGLKTLE